ncbi:MAG: hypothetical protein C0524_10490 [Rhodobacter sp.]|nr:hypothetical protein [Rhodobacter sp.]
METRRKLSVTLAALVVAGQIGGGSSFAAVTPDLAQSLQDYLAAGDFRGLVAFVEGNPDLVGEGSPLAGPLLQLHSAYADEGCITAFSPAAIAELEAALTVTAGQILPPACLPAIY